MWRAEEVEAVVEQATVSDSDSDLVPGLAPVLVPAEPEWVRVSDSAWLPVAVPPHQCPDLRHIRVDCRCNPG